MATWKQYNVEDIFYLRLPLDNRYVCMYADCRYIVFRQHLYNLNIYFAAINIILRRAYACKQLNTVVFTLSAFVMYWSSPPSLPFWIDVKCFRKQIFKTSASHQPRVPLMRGPGWRKLRAERDEVAEFRRDRDEEVSWRRVGEVTDQEGAGGAIQPPEARLQPRAFQQTQTAPQHLRHPLWVWCDVITEDAFLEWEVNEDTEEREQERKVVALKSCTQFIQLLKTAEEPEEDDDAEKQRATVFQLGDLTWW